MNSAIVIRVCYMRLINFPTRISTRHAQHLDFRCLLSRRQILLHAFDVGNYIDVRAISWAVVYTAVAGGKLFAGTAHVYDMQRQQKRENGGVRDLHTPRLNGLFVFISIF